MRDSVRTALKSGTCVWNNNTGALMRKRAYIFYSCKACSSYFCGIDNRLCDVFVSYSEKGKER